MLEHRSPRPRPRPRPWPGAQAQFATDEYVSTKATIGITEANFEERIRDLMERGWPRHDAVTFKLLSTVAGAISRALREEDRCYAAATYALRGALSYAIPRNRRLAKRLSTDFLAAGSRNSGSDVDDLSLVDVPEKLYWHRSVTAVAMHMHRAPRTATHRSPRTVHPWTPAFTHVAACQA